MDTLLDRMPDQYLARVASGEFIGTVLHDMLEAGLRGMLAPPDADEGNKGNSGPDVQLHGPGADGAAG